MEQPILNEYKFPTDNFFLSFLTASYGKIIFTFENIYNFLSVKYENNHCIHTLEERKIISDDIQNILNKILYENSYIFDYLEKVKINFYGVPFGNINIFSLKNKDFEISFDMCNIFGTLTIECENLDLIFDNYNDKVFEIIKKVGNIRELNIRTHMSVQQLYKIDKVICKRNDFKFKFMSVIYPFFEKSGDSIIPYTFNELTEKYHFENFIMFTHKKLDLMVYDLDLEKIRDITENEIFHLQNCLKN